MGELVMVGRLPGTPHVGIAPSCTLGSAFSTLPHMKRFALSTLFAALLVFAWSSVSWMLIGWHEAGMHAFADEAAVARVLTVNAPQPGLYLLPSAQPQATLDQAAEQMRAGPFLYGSVRVGQRNWSMPTVLAKSFATQLAGAFLLTAMLGTMRLESYGGRVAACALAGLFAGVVGHIPQTTWWEFPWSATLVNIADLTISWFLGGLVIAHFTSPVRSHSSSWVR